MTVEQWLAGREPEPPPALADRMRAVLGDDRGRAASEACDVLLAGGRRLLMHLLGNECETRDAALDLLAADALVTYAFEAASEEPSSFVARARDAMRSLAAVAKAS